MSSITTIRWDNESEARLTQWAERTGRTVESLVEEAVREKLDDSDDYDAVRAGLDTFIGTSDGAIGLTKVEWPTTEIG